LKVYPDNKITVFSSLLSAKSQRLYMNRSAEWKAISQGKNVNIMVVINIPIGLAEIGDLTRAIRLSILN